MSLVSSMPKARTDLLANPMLHVVERFGIFKPQLGLQDPKISEVICSTESTTLTHCCGILWGAAAMSTCRVNQCRTAPSEQTILFQTAWSGSISGTSPLAAGMKQLPMTEICGHNKSQKDSQFKTDSLLGPSD